MTWLDRFTQFNPKKDVVPEIVRDRDESFAPLEIPDAVMTVASGGYLQTTMNFNTNTTTEAEKISSWRCLAKNPEIAWAVNEIINDAIITDGNSYPCEIVFDEESEVSEKIKETLNAEFRYVLKLMNFKRKGVDLFKQWYVDGRVYYHGILDTDNPKKGLVGVRWVDPRNIKRVIEMDEKPDKNGFKVQVAKDDYYVYHASYGGVTNNMYGNANSGVPTMAIRVNPECVAFASSGMFSENSDGSSYSVSFLDVALKSFNILTSLEQAMTVYRLARATERRVFYVDVGNLPKDKADQYLSNVMAKFKRKLTFNTSTGLVSSENNELGIMDDFWLPRKEGGRGTEVTTLTSGQAWSDMNDLEWFQKKVLRALNIPFGRFQSDGMFSMGRSMEITREEVKFAKFISTLRSRYSQALIQLLKIQVISKNILTIEEFEEITNELNVKWKTDAYWDELLFNEMWQTRLNLLQQFDNVVGKYVSNEWIQRNVLQQDDNDIKTERERILKERKDDLFKPPVEDED